LSEGERWRLALDLAIEALGDGDAVLSISQSAWEGLDGNARRAINEHARSRGTVIVTAEADHEVVGELRAEVFSGGQPGAAPRTSASTAGPSTSRATACASTACGAASSAQRATASTGRRSGTSARRSGTATSSAGGGRRSLSSLARRRRAEVHDERPPGPRP